MRCILFVDDEPKVLDALRRMLRGMRAEWHMEFATSGPEALERMARAPFDVLVTDMRMPGMDGAQLLGEVRGRFPRTVRIVLTGECGRDAVVHSAALAHRHLTKPCEADTLRAAITRACALQDLLQSDQLLALASRMSSVPSRPALYQEVVRELKSADPSLTKVGRIIAQDAGMTAKIMQVVNSAFFGLRSRATHPSQAVMYLGAEMTKTLVLAANIFSRFDGTALEAFSVDAMWDHSQLTSGLAREVAKAEGADAKVAEEAAMAGLLHDMGKLVLIAHMPAAYQGVLVRAAAEGLAVHEAERVALGATHAELGAYVLGLWGLPETIVEAVAWHHRPGDCPGGSFGPHAAVHVANALAHEVAAGGAEAAVDLEYLRRLGLAHRIADWRALRTALEPEGCAP